MNDINNPWDVTSINAGNAPFLPGHLNIELLEVGKGFATCQLLIQQHHLALNGFMHAGGIVTLADTACGNGTMANLPEGAFAFTTIELKSNHLGTATEGIVRCEAKMRHGGKQTQVWEADVVSEATGKTMALFRCTQMILWPKK